VGETAQSNYINREVEEFNRFGNGRKTYEPTLSETIPFISVSLIENTSFLRQKYVKDKLTIKQIAKETGHSASYVFDSLKRLGIKREAKV
jgi:hypothetical protein